MKEYYKPQIIEADISMEGVYAASGTTVTPTPPIYESEWSARIEWTNHNGGSHSDVGIRLSRNGKKLASNFSIELTTSFDIGSVSQLSAPGTATVSVIGNKITIVVSDWTMNPSQNGFISFQITDTDSLYGGAIYASNTHLYEEATQFTITKCECW